MFLLVLLYSYLVKILVVILRVLKIGNGTTWPGLFFEKLSPSAVRFLVNKDCNITLISGTNGKTTTRSMLVKILEGQNIEVCTNRGGANILRGVTAALLSNLTLVGQPKAKNIILEVEEATMPILTKFIKPNKIILTNIFRDQMDAYGEIDTTLNYFSQALDNLGSVRFDLIINKDDRKLLSILNKDRTNINLIGYGIDDESVILPDYELSENNSKVAFQSNFVAKNITSKNLEVSFQIENVNNNNFIIKEKYELNLTDFFDGGEALNDNQYFPIKTSLLGTYNIYNILAAFAAAFDDFGQSATESLQNVTPVFGRGEKVNLPNGSQAIMFLVKNPAGMNQVFELIKTNFEPNEINLNFLINDNIADGRDVSWLWDCNFEDLVKSQTDLFKNKETPTVIMNSTVSRIGVHPILASPRQFQDPLTIDKLAPSTSINFKTSGNRGLDMLLRLETAGANVSLQDNFEKVSGLVTSLNQKEVDPKIQLVLATYTAMLEFRSELGKIVELGGIGEKGN